MVSGTETNKYMVVSVWANTWTSSNQGSQNLVIEFGQNSWGSTTQWSAPTMPSTTATAISMGASFLYLGGVATGAALCV